MRIVRTGLKTILMVCGLGVEVHQNGLELTALSFFFFFWGGGGALVKCGVKLRSMDFKKLIVTMQHSV
jgi:hypothetical protein